VLTRDDCFFLGGGADKEVYSVAAGSSAVGLSDAPLALMSSWVLALDDFFLFFSSDILSLDFQKIRISVSLFSTSTEVEVGCL
jgi:hypothetical protein